MKHRYCSPGCVDHDPYITSLRKYPSMKSIKTKQKVSNTNRKYIINPFKQRTQPRQLGKKSLMDEIVKNINLTKQDLVIDNLQLNRLKMNVSKISNLINNMADNFNTRIADGCIIKKPQTIISEFVQQSAFKQLEISSKQNDQYKQPSSQKTQKEGQIKQKSIKSKSLKSLKSNCSLLNYNMKTNK